MEVSPDSYIIVVHCNIIATVIICVGIKLHTFLLFVNILVLLVIIKTKVMRNWVDRVEN